ncbi:MAG: prolipoprotein diacylglyceryl transferase [Desulfonatronovibrio sp.]
MHPVLIEFGPITLYSYGFFVAAAFLLGMAWTMREAEISGLDSRIVLSIGFYVLAGGLAGSRLLYVLVNPDLFQGDPLGIFKFWKGGLAFMGGAAAAGFCMIVVLYRRKEKILPWLDACAPGVALGLFTGWLGCLAAGCGYGKPADLPWSIILTHPDAAGPLFVPMHPVQAYQALAALACFIILLLIRGNFKASGQRAGFFLVVYVLLRMLIDFFRADIQVNSLFMSVNQTISLAVVLVGLLLFYLPSRYRGK